MKRKKLAMSTIAIATAAAVTVTTILSSGVQSTYAQESFNGLDEIVAGKEYKILEIVPDLSLAKLGLLAEGQESFYDPTTGHSGSFADILAGLKTKTEREYYVDLLNTKMATLLAGTSDSKVLSSSSYQESYVQTEGYEELLLTDSATLGKDSADLNGYYIKDLGEGATSGHYVLDSKFVLASANTDASLLYSQNVAFYDVGADNKYYKVEFKLTDTVADGMGAYEPSDGALITQDIWESMADGEMLYVLSSDGASFTLCEKGTQAAASGTENSTDGADGAGADAGTATDANTGTANDANAGTTTGADAGTATDANTGTANDANAGTATDADVGTTTDVDASAAAEQQTGENGLPLVTEFQSNRYYLVYFQYVYPSEVNTSAGRKYYEPYQITFSADADGNATGTYGAVLDSAEPYVSDSKNGHFIKDVDNMYYMLSENGRYELTTDSSDKKPDYDVEVDRIYYTGGLSSTNLLTESVFNQSGLLNEDGAEFTVTVDTLLPGAVTVEMANNYDMIVLSNSSMYSLKENPTNYGTGNDLQSTTADVIYSLVTDSSVYKPVVVDASILDDEEEIGDTNIYKLARLLSSEDLNTNEVSFSDGTWTTKYGPHNSDFDGYFVNGNILSVPGDGTAIADGKLGSHTFSFLEAFDSSFIEVTESRTEYENFSDKAESEFQTTATELGFGEVAGCIADENFIRESENASRTKNEDKYKFFDLRISRAICMEYIICYVSRRDTSTVETIQILDIEPCTVSTASQSEIETNIKKLLELDGSSIKVEFTHMTSAELISKVEDLCKYDLIYMGLYTDSMNTTKKMTYYAKSDTSKSFPLNEVPNSWYGSDYTSEYTMITSYNDTSMNGLIYTNTGDTRTGSSFAGVLDTDYTLRTGGTTYGRYYQAEDGTWVAGSSVKTSDYNKVRYSGNDLTKEKLEDLQDYVKSAAPVILADDFITTSVQSDGSYKRVVNSQNTVTYYTASGKGNNISYTEKNVTENGVIDNCSRMYTLIDSIAATTTYKNVKTYTEWKDNISLLNRYITLGKPQLNVIESAKVEGQEYVKTDGDKVVIDFTVQSYGAVSTKASFQAELFVDFNADGRYSKSTEKIDAYSFNIYLVDKKADSKKKINPVTETANGQENVYYSLPALNGKTDTQYYSLEYTVQKSYLGVYPVKLVVEQQDNEYRYSYWEGYYYHEKTAVSTSEGTSLEEVKVLQILPVSLYDTNKTLFDMDLTGTYENGNDTKNTAYAEMFKNKYKDHSANTFFNASDLSSRYSSIDWDYGSDKTRWTMLIDTFKNSTFYQYAFNKSSDGNQLGGYDLQIDSVFTDTMVNYFTSMDDAYNYVFDDEAYQEFLDYYDMIILGFGDGGDYFSYTNKLKDTTMQQMNLEEHYYAGIHNFIKSGKSILFTHDTTSFRATYTMETYQSVKWETGHLSDLLAGDVGFDRYGVYDNEDSLLSLVLSAGIDNLEKNGAKTYQISTYPSLARAKRLGLLAEYDSSLTKDSDKDTISEATLFNIIVTESDEEHENKDVSYEPNSNKTILTNEVQSRSTIAINRQSSKSELTNFASSLNGKSCTTSWGETRTNSAELLNVGQILIYPYNVYSQIKSNGGILNIAETHYQYFQIDMNADEDNDGESDITVWLSLTDNSSSSQIEYNVAQRDARNNYYIYTKGNVTYSGVGHANMNTSEYAAETQLYINTIIASYQASVQKPEVSIKEDADSTSLDLDTIYVSMDSTISVDELGIGTVTDGAELDNTQEPSEYKIETVSSEGSRASYWITSIAAADGTKDSGLYEEVYLFVQDTNVTRGTEKQISLKYYLILDSLDDAPNDDLKNIAVDLNAGKTGVDPVYAIPLDLETYSLIYDENGNQTKAEFDERSENVVSGKSYCVEIPYYLLADGLNRAEIRCYVTTTISTKNTVTNEYTKISESTSYDSVYLQRISLFDLE